MSGLKKDLTDLPSPGKDEGLQPDTDDTYTTVLVNRLRQGIDWTLPVEYHVNKPQADLDTLTRHSKAATCMKEVALERDGVDREPMDDAGLHVTFLGTLLHAAWQQAIAETWPDVVFEQSSTLQGLTSGSCDGLRAYDPSNRHVLELKTEGEYSYDLQIGLKGAPAGPKPSHLAQLALNVVGHDADRGTVVLMRRSSISAGQAERHNLDTVRRFGAQFTLSREQLQPYADQWLAQLEWIRDHDTDDVPRHHPHEMPKGAVVVDPLVGRWELHQDGDIVDTGAVWGDNKCRHYCSVRDACIERWKDGR